MKIKAKLLIMFVVLLLVPGIIISFFGYQNSSKSVDEVIEKGLKSNVQVALQLIETQYKAVEAGLISVDEAQEEIKRQLIGEKTTTNTRELTEQFELGEHGYFVIFDADGNTIGHPNLEGENLWDLSYEGVYFIQEMIEQAQVGNGFTYYNYPMSNDPKVVREKITYTEESPYWGWIVGVNSYTHEYSESTNYLLITTIITLMITVLIGLFFGNFFANHISRPLGFIVEQANAIAEGKLVTKKLSFKRSDEIDSLASAMNVMAENLRHLILQVSEASTQVDKESESLAQVAGEVLDGSAQVAATMQELSTATDMEANLATELASSMAVFGTKMDAVNDSGLNLRRGFSEVLQLTDDGQAAMENSVDQMSSINKIVQSSVMDVRHLDQESKKITELVSVIKSISEQTNLLALNAAIEAARAGEHGAGFAVVADEVRNLAEEVADSLTDISNVVSGIQSETSSVTVALEEGYQEVESGTKLIADTQSIFSDITNAVNEMVKTIEAATSNLLDIANETKEMDKKISDIAAISEESAAGIEQTTASADQSSHAMREVTNKTNELVDLAQQLNHHLSRFDLG